MKRKISNEDKYLCMIETGKKTVTVRVDILLYREIKKWAIDRNMPIGEAMEEAMKGLLISKTGGE